MDLLSRVFETHNIKILPVIIEEEEEIAPYFCARL